MPLRLALSLNADGFQSSPRDPQADQLSFIVGTPVWLLTSDSDLLNQSL